MQGNLSEAFGRKAVEESAPGKLTYKLSEEEAWGDVDDFGAWNPLPVGIKCLKVASYFQIRYKIFWWDSLIVGAASIAGCETILSEDLNSGQQYTAC